jgi:thiamine pyrophosphokinase
LPQTRAIIIANGELPHPTLALPLIGADDLIIAADGGTRHCQTLGLTPHILIGDLDSTPESEITRLQATGTRVLRYPVHKDQTDLELALDWAIQNEVDDIIVLAALGGRWDQTLANLLLPTLPAFKAVRIRLVDGPQQISALRGPGAVTLTGSPGDTVSLIPVGGAAVGVTLSGLEYPLFEATIQLGSTLGISNVMTHTAATVELHEGRLICVVISKEQA